MSSYLIWWTDQSQCEEAYKRANQGAYLPHYLKVQLGSRYGRAGRGRLWISPILKKEFSVDPWPDTDLARKLGDSFGGIVFPKKLLKLIRQFPGIITDHMLNVVEEKKIHIT